MTAPRASWAAAERLAPRLTDRDWLVVTSLKTTRVLTGDQLRRLHFSYLSNHTQHRTTRHVLQRLADWQVLTRLERTIGGVRAGSTGWTYSLGPLGQRLLELHPNQRSQQRIRKPWTPSLLFLQHSLAVAELYVQLTEHSRSGQFQLADYAAEPACWWPDGLGGWLKPDAYLILRTADYDELIWLEVDRATESLPTLRRKLLTYQQFRERGQLGPAGVMPHVVITVPTTERTAAIHKLIDQLDTSQPLFTVTTFTAATAHLLELAGIVPEKPP